MIEMVTWSDVVAELERLAVQSERLPEDLAEAVCWLHNAGLGHEADLAARCPDRLREWLDAARRRSLAALAAAVPVPWELIDQDAIQSPYVTSNFPNVAVWERDAGTGSWRLAGLFIEDGADGRLTDVHPDGSELWAAGHAAQVMGIVQ